MPTRTSTTSPSRAAATGRVFVGQRKEPFAVNLGEVFDLVNIRTRSARFRDAEPNDLDDKNITSLILEVPIACLCRRQDPVIGGWTTASLPRNRDLDQRPARAAIAASARPATWSRCRGSACRWSTRS